MTPALTGPARWHNGAMDTIVSQLPDLRATALGRIAPADTERVLARVAPERVERVQVAAFQSAI